MKIGLDFDDIITDFLSALLEYHNGKYKRNDKLSDFKEYKYWPVWGVDRDEETKRVLDFHDDGSFDKIKPIRDAVESVNKLSERHKLFIITARSLRFEQKTEAWIKKHFGKKIKVLYSGDFFTGTASNKAKICLNEGISLMLEDNMEYALDCAKNGIRVILFDKPWNQDVEHKNVIRVFDWKEAIKEIEKIDGSRRN